MESILQSLSDQLQSNDVQVRFQEMLKELSNATPEIGEKVHVWFMDRVNCLLQLLKDICIDGDESELKIQLPTIWLQMRLEWNLYNLETQYETMT